MHVAVSVFICELNLRLFEGGVGDAHSIEICMTFFQSVAYSINLALI